METPYGALHRLGSQITPEMIAGTAGLFAAGAPQPLPGLCSVAWDLPYGAHPRQRLNLFQPTAAAAGERPIVLFVHGGGFVQGDKGGRDEPFFNNVGAWAARHGFVGATMSYRLAPDHPWPAGSQDVALAAEWLAREGPRFGGDPTRIVLMGHSAGAVHVAGCLAGHHGGPVPEGIAAAVMLNGLYDLVSLAHSPLEGLYFGTDTRRHAEQSSLVALVHTEVPCLYGVAELDPMPFQQQAAALAERYWQQRHAYPPLLYLQGHNHLSAVFQLGAGGDTLGPQLAAYIGQQAGRATRAPGGIAAAGDNTTKET